MRKSGNKQRYPWRLADADTEACGTDLE